MQDKQQESDFDVRIIDRNIASGRLTSERLEQHISELEDCESEAEWTATRMAMPPEVEEVERREEA
jgi:hypothetical protein